MTIPLYARLAWDLSKLFGFTRELGKVEGLIRSIQEVGKVGVKSALKRELMHLVIPSAIRHGLSGRQILEHMVARGLGIRRGDFYRIYRDIRAIMRAQERIRRALPDEKVTADMYAPGWRNQRWKHEAYIRVIWRDPISGEQVDSYFGLKMRTGTKKGTLLRKARGYFIENYLKRMLPGYSDEEYDDMVSNVSIIGLLERPGGR